MKIEFLVCIKIFYLFLIIETFVVKSDEFDENDSRNHHLIHMCVGLKQSQVDVCNRVELEDDIITEGLNCKLEDCKISCCKNVKECFKSHFLNFKREECISEKMEDDFGQCCKITSKKYTKSKLLYLSGGLGLAVLSTGLYLFLTSKSNTRYTYDPNDTYDVQSTEHFEAEYPHMEVNQIVATDGEDVFWSE